MADVDAGTGTALIVMDNHGVGAVGLLFQGRSAAAEIVAFGFATVFGAQQSPAGRAQVQVLTSGRADESIGRHFEGRSILTLTGTTNRFGRKPITDAYIDTPRQSTSDGRNRSYEVPAR